MKVTLQTYGGLTGMGQPAVAVDSAGLGTDAQQDLRRLVSAASVQPESADDPGSARDAQAYQITIEEPGGPPVVLEAVDGRVPADFAQLREWLREHGT